MLRRELATCAPDEAVAAAGRRLGDRRRGPLALLTAVTSGLSLTREPRTARERLEQELRALTRARSVTLREDGPGGGPGGSICVDLPSIGAERPARLEVGFDPGRTPDDWTEQLLEAAAHVAALILELERAQMRQAFSSRTRPDGAAPLIGSSGAIRALRERIARVAATDFTVLVEGAIDPQAHPGFIEV